jgi:malonate-semialdehyde dehydrogenase (acetylating)/methylmalonate-semialdehyde dehydrogenase
VFTDAQGEIGRGLDVVEYVCGIPSLLKGEYSRNASTNLDVYSFREPVGVCAGITPFNFPVMCPMWMAPVAIAAGNTIIIKPSREDPSASNFIAKLWEKAGLPKGVFNVVLGDRNMVQQILEHPDIKAISFVGSSPVGHHIYEDGTKNGKRVQSLTAAKNHAIVMPDANIDFAASNVVAAAFGAAGERCMALPVVLVHEAVADEFIAKTIEGAKKVRVNQGMDLKADMGAIISASARDKIEEIITDAEQNGAKVLLDGRGFRPEGYKNGFFTGPTILDDVTFDMRAYEEEIFGPVLVVMRIKSLEEGIEIINEKNPYGNGSAIFTSSGYNARTFSHEVRAGMIGINVPIPVPVAYYSFGGWEDSLVGESHIYGPEGVNFYTVGKVLTQRWLAPSEAEKATFHFAGAGGN